MRSTEALFVHLGLVESIAKTGAVKPTHLLHPGAIAKDRQRLELGRRIAEELEALLGAGDHALAHHRVEHARHRELGAVQLQVALLDAAGSEKLL